ncbi:MAG: universal stress protein [Halioglobus sp.]|jgi:nucleotide-binding universal stress UspA family protein
MATDFSQAGENTVKIADTLAGGFCASLTILRVIEHFPEDMPVSVVPPEDVDPQKYLTDRALSYLETLSARIGQSGVALEVITGVHSASREIVLYAQKHAFDLMVVGSQRVLGPTANSVVRAAIVDVLVVHPTE